VLNWFEELKARVPTKSPYTPGRTPFDSARRLGEDYSSLVAKAGVNAQSLLRRFSLPIHERSGVSRVLEAVQAARSSIN